MFDFDGVIVESNDLKNQAWGELFAADYPQHVDEILRFQLENVGLSRYDKFPVIYRDILGIPFPDGEMERLDREFSRLVVDGVLACELVPGARPFLERRQLSYLLYVASATPELEVREIVRRRGLAELFTDVYGSPATKAQILRRIAAENGLTPREVLFVGDARNDLEAAQEADTWFVGRIRNGEPNPFADEIEVPLVEDLAELNLEWNELVEQLLGA